MKGISLAKHLEKRVQKKSGIMRSVEEELADTRLDGCGGVKGE